MIFVVALLGIFPFFSSAQETSSPLNIIIRNKVKDLSFSWKQTQVKNFSGEIEISTTPHSRTVKISEATIGKLIFPSLEWFPSDQIRLQGTLYWDRQKNEIKTDDLSLSIPQVGTLWVDAFIPLEKEGARIHLRGKKLDLKPILARKFDRVKDFSLNCPVDLDLTFNNPSPALWDWKTSLQLRNGSFSDPSFFYSAEKLDFDASAQGSFDSNTSKTDTEFGLRIFQGETLFNRFYFDFAKTPFSVSLKNSLLEDFQKLTIPNLEVRLDSVFECKANGSVGNLNQLDSVRLNLSLPVQALEPFMNTFVKEPLGEQRPWLKEIGGEGNWAWNLVLTGSLQHPLVEGSLQLQDVSFQNPDRKNHLQKLEGYIPLWLDFSGSSGSVKKTDDKIGYLRWKDLRVGWFNLPTFNLPFGVFVNGFRLSRPVEIPLWNDALKIRDLEVRNILSDRRGHLDVQADQLHLDPLFKTWLGQSIPAVVKTEQWSLKLESKDLESEGNLLLDVFSGNVRIENFRISRFLSPGQVIALDAQWDGVNLEELTQVTEFGKITGQLKGQLKDFRMSYGTPTAFDMTLSSVPAKGIPQQISVIAVDNLAQVGTAQSPFQGVTGGLIGTFFKDFYYEKIGIECKLQNDYFRIRGLIYEGDTEYLVKGSALRGVSIINRNPDNRIAWEDMIGRLKRITHSKPSEEP